MRITSAVAATALVVLGGQVANVHAEVIIETVTVGNPGNADDTHFDGYGGVDYVYNIGKFEVTAGQYTEFLNAVAATDTHGLYITNMHYTVGCNIQYSGSPGSYTYSVAGDWADRPVNWVSWGDAARFANWLHNGQPTGVQDLTTTEDGSYYLNGATSHEDLATVVREVDATWVIPSEDEWYKAAYYDSGSGVYYDYPTSSDSAPGYVNDSGNLSGTGTAFTEGGTDPGRYATYDGDGGGNGIGSPYYRTEVGEWENSDSPYGTSDQGGNVSEWNEDTSSSGVARMFRGGPFSDNAVHLRANSRVSVWASHEHYYIGFRVATRLGVCGDGMIVGLEECDDGNTDDGDGCSGTCMCESLCGNGVPEDPCEECDDGGESAICDANCTLAECGDGTFNATAGEECDDGSDNSDTDPDACRTDCMAPLCADGVVDTGEECDDGLDNSDTEPDACRTNCMSAFCGDGVVDSAEECDDGNIGAGDGCDDTCQIEFGACCVGTACRVTVASDCLDSDGVFFGIGSPCDAPDADGDGLRNECDGCPYDPNKIEPGICGCDRDDNADSDADGVPDCHDRCLGVDDAVFAPGCDDAIPTVSTWGLVVLGLLLLVGHKIHLSRRTT